MRYGERWYGPRCEAVLVPMSSGAGLARPLPMLCLCCCWSAELLCAFIAVPCWTSREAAGGIEVPGALAECGGDVGRECRICECACAQDTQHGQHRQWARWFGTGTHVGKCRICLWLCTGHMTWTAGNGPDLGRVFPTPSQLRELATEFLCMGC